MAINVDSLKARVEGLVIQTAPDAFTNLANYTTKCYASPFSPGQTMLVTTSSSEGAERNPADYVGTTTGLGGVTLNMNVLQAKKHLTFAEIQQNLQPDDLVAALLQDLNLGLAKLTVDAATAGSAANIAVAADLEAVWKAVKGEGKSVLFNPAYLTALQSKHDDYKMGENNVMEPGYLGFTYAKYADEMPAGYDCLTAPGAVAWSKQGLILGLGEMLPIGDDNEKFISVGNGLPRLYSRITVDENTRKVTVTLEMMADIKRVATGLAGAFKTA